MMATYLFSYLFPVLLVVLLLGSLAKRVKPDVSGRLLLVVNCCLAAIIVMIPINGLSVGRWIYSINANVSIVFTVILLHKILVNYLDFDLLDKTAMKTAWIYGALMGIFLYPLAMGMSLVDPYEWGFSFSGFFVIAMFFTLLLLIKGNAFGLALMAAVLGLNLGLLESINLWDYLIDPFYFLFSLGMITTMLTKRFFIKKDKTNEKK